MESKSQVNRDSEICSINALPDSLLLQIFSHLVACDVLSCTQVCARWRAVAYDESLWKKLVYRHWNIGGKISPGHSSWRSEYKRLFYHAPLVWSETLTEHTDEVLHVSFSHNGSLFATTSKDCTVKVWKVGYPTELRNSYDFKEEYQWDSIDFCCFNECDTMLLASCVKTVTVHIGFGAILSIMPNFGILRIVSMDPFGLYGTWLNGHTLIGSSWYENEEDTSYKTIDIKMFEGKAIPDTLPSNLNATETNSGHTFFTFKTQSRTRFLTVAHVPTHGTTPADEAKSMDKLASCKNVSSVNEESHSMSSLPPSLAKRSLKELNKTETSTDNSKQCTLIFLTSDFDVTMHKLSYKEESDGTLCDITVERTKEFNTNSVITGLSLSKDHRYLFVNCRPSIGDIDRSDPLAVPELSSDVELRVIDLQNMRDTEVRYKGHKGLSQSPYWFIFLDSSDNYVSSGSEDTQAYLWDRHYQCCLGTFSHGPGVVNAVGFNPRDEEYFVTVSDDHTIKIWRSRNRQSVLNTQPVDR